MRQQLPFALFVGLISCNSSKTQAPKTNNPKPATVATKEPEKKPETKPASEPVASAPASDLVLSLLEDNAAKCDWKKLDPIAKQTKVIASFEGECRGAEIAFSADKNKALAWFNPEMGSGSYFEDKMTPAFIKEEPESTNKTQRLFEVDINSGKVTNLALPPRGKLSDIGYNAKNEALAFVEEESKFTDGKNPTIDFDGKKIPVESEEGSPILVHAFTLKTDKWEISETKGSTTGADMAMGLHALDSFKDLSPRTTELLSPHPSGGKAAEGALAERLKTYAPKLATREGEWLQLEPSVLVWMVSIEFVFATGKVVFDDGSKFIEPPNLGFTDGDLIAPMVQGNYLLVAQSDTGRYPRVYDIKERTLLFSSDTARAVVFWPK
jgi:hypothetical protein